MRWLIVDRSPTLTREVIRGGMLPKLVPAARHCCMVSNECGYCRRRWRGPAGPLQLAGSAWNRGDGGMTKLGYSSIQAAEAKLLLSTYERNPILFVGGQACLPATTNRATNISTCSAASA